MDGVESPHSPYGVSKASADLYCQEYAYVYGVPTVVNRMSAIYGPWQRGLEEQGWLVWFMINKIKETDGYNTAKIYALRRTVANKKIVLENIGKPLRDEIRRVDNWKMQWQSMKTRWESNWLFESRMGQ